MLLMLVAALLQQGPVSPDQPLPPNHPKLSNAPVAPGEQLPPGHPSIEGAAPVGPVKPGAELPADHPPVKDGAQAPSTEELIKKLDAMGDDLKKKDKPFSVAASLGRLYFLGGRYPEAIGYLEEAVKKAQPAKDFYLQKVKEAGKKAIPAAGAVGCAPPPNTELEDQLKKAEAQKDAAAAAACARAGLEPLMEVEDSLAAAKFLTRDAPGAVDVYTRDLALFPANPDARYGRGAVLLDSKGDDVKSLQLAKADFEGFLKDYPTHPRAAQVKAFLSRVDDAIAKGGVSKAPPKTNLPKVDPHAAMNQGPMMAQQPPMMGGQQPPQLTKEMIDAVQNTERTPEMEQGFQKLVEEAEGDLAKGQFQDALDKYKRVVPFEPGNGRAKAGMAWSLVRMNRQPMADNVWNVAAQDPAAIDALGDSLKAKGDPDGAKQLWQRLASTVPSYASKLSGKL